MRSINRNALSPITGGGSNVDDVKNEELLDFINLCIARLGSDETAPEDHQERSRHTTCQVALHKAIAASIGHAALFTRSCRYDGRCSVQQWC